MKNLLFASALMLLMCMTVHAQFGTRLGNAIERAAENAAIRKAEQKTDQAVSNAIDKATDANTYKDEGTGNSNSQQQTSAPANTTPANTGSQPATGASAAVPVDAVKAAEMAYNKFDFVAGDEIIFEDNMVGEKVGEFPSKWDLIEGEAEIAKMNGENVIVIKKGGYIRPLMKDIYNYLGDVYTIEFDYWYTLKKEDESHGDYWIGLVPAGEKWWGYRKFNLNMPGHIDDWYWSRNEKKINFTYDWETTSDEGANGNREEILTPGNWVHISMSFNKRAMKVYINENRIANIPNMKSNIGWLAFWYGHGDDNRHGYIRNFRVAKGAVPLYDRMMTNGRFITYGITFDVGKSIIKPESMGEINRIVEMMNENSDLKFSVEGHTDNTGSAATNQTLSEARSKAIVDKLIEMGISADRLKSAGKGQTNPIADNGTDEGKAKNRRVEFVKT